MARIGQRSLLALAAFLLLNLSVWADYPTGYDQAYIDSVNDAKQPLTSLKIDYQLTTIGANDHIRNPSLPGNPILMTCFTDWNGYNRSYNGVTTDYRPKIWATVAPEMWQFFQDNNTPPDDMNLRAKQLLGIPASASPYFVMEFYVQPTSLWRPAMDPNIADPVTSLTFTGAMADPNSAMRKWFDNRNNTIYNDSQNPPYPWTRAGYTYDWGIDTAAHIGLTEFIADYQDLTNVDLTQRQTNPIWVRSVISLMSYKYYLRDSDSFDVTDHCDTLWLGSNYLPVTPGGNWVNIHAGVQISGGEGITVTDMADPTQVSNWTITNAGTIQGPGVNHNGTTRQSSVQFANTGGTLVNTGTITGDAIGVLGNDTCTRPIIIDNSGTIRGSQFAIRTGGGNDQVMTSGLVDGNINTGPGDDTITVLGGVINGSIDGGLGANILNFNLPGNGTFAFANNILEMSQVNVQRGTAILNGQITGNVSVYSGATLGGNSTIHGDLANFGTVSPGNSIGTTTVAGNYTQASGGALTIQLAKLSPGTLIGDQLNVTGAGHTATLAAGSFVDVCYGPGSDSVFRAGETFHAITTTGGVTNQGAVVATPSAFLAFTGGVQGNDYVLTLHRTATFGSLATPGNNAAIANALDADATTAAGAYADSINFMLFGSAAELNNTLGQLSPAAYFSVEAAADRTTQYMAESTADYLRGRRAGQVNPCPVQLTSYRGATAMAEAVGSPTELAGVVKFCGDARTTIDESQEIDRTRSVWVNPFGVFFGERSLGDHLGFQANTGGLQCGIDNLVSDNCIFGLGGGYNQTHIDTADQFSADETETFRIGPYGTWFNNEWYLDASLTAGFHDNNMGRQVDLGGDMIARGAYRAQDVSLYLDGGRDYHCNGCTISPLVSLQYIYYHQDGFTETGADGANLAVDPLRANSLRSRVGMQVLRVQQWGSTKIVPEVFGGWAHEYLATQPLEAQFIGGLTPFSIDRGGIFRDAGYYGAIVTLVPSDRASIFARYNGEWSSGGHFNAIDLGLVFDF